MTNSPFSSPAPSASQPCPEAVRMPEKHTAAPLASDLDAEPDEFATAASEAASAPEAMEASSVFSAPEIRFPQGLLGYLRGELFADSRKECFALLAGRRVQSPDGKDIIVVSEAHLPAEEDIESSARYHVRPSRAFIASVLAEVQSRADVDCIVDVHTHPFARHGSFSSIDDDDERKFCRCLAEKVDGHIHYASIVLGMDSCSARIWHMEGGRANFVPARVKAQTMLETIPTEGFRIHTEGHGMLARAELALGVDVLRRMASDQLIVLAGAGGIGSVLAEMLVRSGFTNIGLIDSDILEVSNLNRFAGGCFADVGLPKVQVVARWLERIRPGITVTALESGVESPEAESLMARADWVMLSTDSHSSRYTVQKTCLRYGVPLISAGVNITVEKDADGRHRITDQSGEVILARHGDGFCLNCLGRIDPAKVAAESHPEKDVRTGLVERGYVQGMDVKEPAVMPLNAVVAAQAVQTLIDQYREGAVCAPVTVYESHAGGRMWADWESMDALPRSCFSCGRDLPEDVMREDGIAEGNGDSGSEGDASSASQELPASEGGTVPPIPEEPERASTAEGKEACAAVTAAEPAGVEK